METEGQHAFFKTPLCPTGVEVRGAALVFFSAAGCRWSGVCLQHWSAAELPDTTQWLEPRIKSRVSSVLTCGDSCQCVTQQATPASSSHHDMVCPMMGRPPLALFCCALCQVLLRIMSMLRCVVAVYPDSCNCSLEGLGPDEGFVQLSCHQNMLLVSQRWATGTQLGERGGNMGLVQVVLVLTIFYCVVCVCVYVFVCQRLSTLFVLCAFHQ